MKHKYKELTNAKANYSGSFIIPKPTELSDNNIPKSRKICKEGLTFTPANESSLWEAIYAISEFSNLFSTKKTTSETPDCSKKIQL